MLTTLYFIALLILFVLDMVWLGFVAKDFYREQLNSLMKTDVTWTAAILFYLLFSAGLVLFVIAPALEKNSLLQAILYGALFGLIAYATYDLTNLAILKHWPLLLSIVDMAWGAALAAVVSGLTYLIAIKLGW